MPVLPSATVAVDDTSGIAVSGLDLLCLFAPCTTLADCTPRQYGSAKQIYDAHGYNEGVEYLALHAQLTKKPVLFVPLPIVTVGAVSRENKSGNTGTSVTTITAGGTGVLGEHDGVWTVIAGGTIGTDQIILGLSHDGGRTVKRVRLGTATSYVHPYFNVTTAFAAGTLVTGDTIHTWFGSAPRSDSAGWALARAALAAQLRGFRSILLCGDVQNSTEANAFNTQLDAYETANERFVFGRVSILDRLPQAAMSRVRVSMTGSPTLTFLEVGAGSDTITRSAGSFITDGFEVGMMIAVAGSVSNNVTAAVTAVSALVLTLGAAAGDDLANEGPVAGCTLTGTPKLTFAEVGATGDTITRSSGSWLTDGFRVGDKIVVTGSVSNNITALVGLTAVTATVLTLNTDDLAAEVIGSYSVTITAGQTKAVWMAASEAAFAAVDSHFRISLGAGRCRVLSPWSDWFMRRPASWFASLREYQHDLHVPVWRKSDGPFTASLNDANGNLVEWDDRVDGEAGTTARFTVMRTWGNGPNGPFIARSLTRALEGSLLLDTHNAAVVNLACTTVQLNTEDAAIGVSLILNPDGTATSDSLGLVTAQVNTALSQELLTDKKNEGQRASQAAWSPNADVLYNVADPTMLGVTLVNLRGTVVSVNTKVRVVTGGQ